MAASTQPAGIKNAATRSSAAQIARRGRGALGAVERALLDKDRASAVAHTKANANTVVVEALGKGPTD